MRTRTLLLALLTASAARAAAQAPAPAPERPRATFYAGEWGFTLGGRIKLDMIHDFDAIGSTDSFDPRTIPVPVTDGANTRIHARETRLSLGIQGPAEGRTLKFYIEGDFYGDKNAFRLRHAYGQYGVLIAGQTWSTFMDEDNIPGTIDFETPLAAPLVRQGLLRLTFPMGRNGSVAVGMEESDPEVVPPTGVTGTVEKLTPDLTGRLRWNLGAGHVQLSGFVGQTRFRATTGATTSRTIGGVLLSGRIRPFRRDAAYAEFAYGPGVGRYRGGPSLAPDENGELNTVVVAALTAGYEHRWSDRWSSNAVYSPGWAVSDLQDPAANEMITYSAVNLLYWFIQDRAWVGAEYLFGRREVQNGSSANANRIQLAVRFNIPSY